MATLNAVAKRYGALTSRERFLLDVLAMARGDKAEEQRLADSCPRETVSRVERGYYERAVSAPILVSALNMAMGRETAALETALHLRLFALWAVDRMIEVAIDAWCDGRLSGLEAGWAASGVTKQPSKAVRRLWREANDANRMKAVDGAVEGAEKVQEQYLRHFDELVEIRATNIRSALDGFDRFCRDAIGVRGEDMLRAWGSPVPDWLADSPGGPEGLQLSTALENAAPDASRVVEWRQVFDAAWRRATDERKR